MGTGMTIRHTSTVTKGYLLVSAEGTSEDANDLFAHVDAFIADSLEMNVGKFLIDHRYIEFPQQGAGVYELAIHCMERVSKILPEKVALVTRKEYMELARFYEAVGVTNGLKIKAFDRIELASSWLSD